MIRDFLIVNKRTKIKITGDYIILIMSYIIHRIEGERRKKKGERRKANGEWSKTPNPTFPQGGRRKSGK
jgi:hypothetical protein